MADGLKIRVTPEGRDGIWLADRRSLKAWIETQRLEEIHNFNTVSPVVIGADHSVESVLDDIDRADRVAVLTGSAQRENLRHALALIMPAERGLPERLEMYDLGPITEHDLERIDITSEGNT